MFMFMTMECYHKPYDIYHVHSRRVIEYQHQWEMEQIKIDDLHEYWTKTIEAIVLQLKLTRGVQVVPLTCVVRQHVKVVHIRPEYDTYLNFDEEMIIRTVVLVMALKSATFSKESEALSWRQQSI